MEWSKYFDLSIQEHDKKKKEYCKEHDIPLVCVPYSKLNHIKGFIGRWRKNNELWTI